MFIFFTIFPLTLVFFFTAVNGFITCYHNFFDFVERQLGNLKMKLCFKIVLRFYSKVMSGSHPGHMNIEKFSRGFVK